MSEFSFSPTKLRAQRERLSLPREAVALAIGKSYETVTAYERGRGVPPGTIVGRLAAVLESDPGDFYEATEAAA